MLFGDGIAGSGIHDSSARFRMYLVVTVGLFALGSVLYWRSQNLLAADYVELPDHAQTVKKAPLAPSLANHLTSKVNE